MKRVGEDQVLISKEELDALLLIASSHHAQDKSDEKKDELMSFAAVVSVTIERHIWGDEQIPEEIVMATMDFLRMARKEEERYEQRREESRTT